MGFSVRNQSLTKLEQVFQSYLNKNYNSTLLYTLVYNKDYSRFDWKSNGNFLPFGLGGEGIISGQISICMEICLSDL